MKRPTKSKWIVRSAVIIGIVLIILVIYSATGKDDEEIRIGNNNALALSNVTSTTNQKGTENIHIEDFVFEMDSEVINYRVTVGNVNDVYQLGQYCKHNCLIEECTQRCYQEFILEFVENMPETLKTEDVDELIAYLQDDIEIVKLKTSDDNVQANNLFTMDDENNVIQTVLVLNDSCKDDDCDDLYGNDVIEVIIVFNDCHPDEQDKEEFIQIILIFNDCCGDDCGCDPTPKPTPTESTTPKPTPTESPTPSPTPTESPTPSPTPTESPTPSPTPTESPTPSPTPTESPTPSPTPTESPTPTPTPTDEWDKSSISVSGYCDSTTGEAVFTVTNGGESMQISTNWYLKLDGKYGTVIQSGTLQLNAGQSKQFRFACEGRTLALVVNQHPKHPGNSMPNAIVEDCGCSNTSDD